MNQPSQVPLEEQTPAQSSRPYRWYHKFSAILLIIFCLEIGTFLLVFPWYGNTWENNFLSSLLHQGYWQNPYFRGAVSGLGIVNLYICFVEILRLRRFW